VAAGGSSGRVICFFNRRAGSPLTDAFADSHRRIQNCPVHHDQPLAAARSTIFRSKPEFKPLCGPLEPVWHSYSRPFAHGKNSVQKLNIVAAAYDRRGFGLAQPR